MLHELFKFSRKLFCHSERQRRIRHFNNQILRLSLRMTKNTGIQMKKIVSISATRVQKSFKILSRKIRKSHNSIHHFFDIKNNRPAKLIARRLFSSFELVINVVLKLRIPIYTIQILKRRLQSRNKRLFCHSQPFSRIIIFLIGHIFSVRISDLSL